MSIHQRQKPQLPSHEPQARCFKTEAHKVAGRQINRRGFSLLGSHVKHWFIDTWLDWVTLTIIGATVAGVWAAPHAFNRLFPVTFPYSGDVVYLELAYPYVESIFSSLAAGLLNIFIPIFVIVLSQLWIHSFHVMANGILGLLYAITTGTCFQVILKKTIGGLRPHFLSVCGPVLPVSNNDRLGTGYRNVMFTIDQVCTGDKSKINNAIESFPSGHAEIAWAGTGYLAIYLFCHLKIRSLSQCRPSYWRMYFVIAPLLFATYQSSTLVLGYHHHGYDVIAGGLIGLMMAFFGYRMVFASIWDPRWNTVPLTKSNKQGDDQQRFQSQRPGEPEHTEGVELSERGRPSV